ncbi:MAG: hypothetical protein OHK0017_12230 [Patescibacteria group bacterium]
MLILDLVIEIYHHICFPIYGLELIERRKYVQVIDRGKLKYLSWFEKISCMYCGYVNGVLEYMSAIAHRTEFYWCAIMHADKPGFEPPKYWKDYDFAKYDDEQDLINKFGK